MTSGRIEFQFEDDGPHNGTDDLAQWLQREFPSAHVETNHRPAPTPPGEHRDLNTTLNVAILILALPQGVKATVDLADRYHLREKLARLIAWAKERRARRLRNPFVALPPHDLKVPLDQAKPEQLLDAVAAPEKSPPP